MARRAPIRSTLRGESWLHNTGSVPARSNAQTHELYAELYHRRRSSPYSDPRFVDRLASQLLAAAVRSRKLPGTLRDAIAACARELVACEADLFQLPQLPHEPSIVQGVETRAILRDRLTLFENANQLVPVWINAIASSLAALVDAIPTVDPRPATLTVPTPIINLIPNPTEIIRQIVTNFIRFAPHPRTTCTSPGANLATRITDNLLAASKINLDAAQRHPERLRWPGADRASPPELVARYLGDTPLASLFDASINIPVPDSVRFEHQHIEAAWGHGKTQLIQSQLISLFDDPRRPSVIFMDSQGDAIRILSRLERFNPAKNDRLTLLDFGDTEWPLRCNLFDVNRARIAKLGIGEREEVLAGIIELYEFIFGALLGSELTGKQELVFRFLARLMTEIPGATIRTLRALLTDPTPYLHHLDSLDDDARDFLANHFFNPADRDYAQTRRQVLRRLFQVFSISPAFGRMFSHEKNAIDFKSAMDSGKIILISTSKARLKTEASRIVGRFCIAQIMQATLERAAQPEQARHPTFFYIDEAHEYFDDDRDGGVLKSVLTSARKYKLAVALAHQDLTQIKSRALRASIMSTAIRFVGAVPSADALALAPDMRTTAEFLANVRKTTTAAEFSCFVRNVTPTATRVTLPFFAAENAPKMSDAAYQKLLARIRSQVASPLSTRPPNQRPATRDLPSPEDDFGEKY